MTSLSLPVLKGATGLVLYDGPSKLDGEEIICIATGLGKKSNNVKTGDMIQTWIMRKDSNPIAASQAGDDESVCGDCKHRRSNGGACYVNLGQAPLNIWKSYHKGNYPVYDKDTHLKYFKGKLLRMGSYGEPTAIPIAVWKELLKVIKGHTAYTHQWNNTKVRRGFKDFVMASVDDEKERAKANKGGWRTFRVKGPDDIILKGEFVCPASEEAGKRLTCQQCLACDGGRPPKASVVIDAHGAIKKRFLERNKNGSNAVKP